MSSDVDLAIVGAGPAGSAAALGALAASPSMRVLILDRASFPRDKVCGDGVGPVGVEAIRELGLRDVLDGATRVDRLRLSTPTGRSAAGRVQEAGYVLPRRILDHRLLEAAISRGAQFERRQVTTLTPRGDRVEVGDGLTAATVIGADGVHSAVRRAIGAGTHPRRHRAVSLRAYARGAPSEPKLDFRLPSDPWPAYTWAFPTGDGEANVGVVILDGRTPATRAGMAELVAETLPEWEPVPGTTRGSCLPLSPGRPALAHGRVLLAGDAAGLVNPVSGEGIATAIVSGVLAGRSAVLAPERPGRAYRAAVHARLRRHFRHAGWASWAMRSPSWVEATVAAAGASPAVFRALADLTVGTGPFPLRAGGRIAQQLVGLRVRGGPGAP